MTFSYAAYSAFMKNQNIPSLIKKIQSVLSDDLLSATQNKRLLISKHPTAGHCYVASEALYHLLGGKKSGLTPCVSSGMITTTHWWLKDKEGNIIDITAEQFTSKGIDIKKKIYPYGRGTGFLTKQPSKRAQEVIRRVKKIDR